MAGSGPSHASDPGEQHDTAAGQQQHERDAREPEGGLTPAGPGELTGARRPVPYAGHGCPGWG